MIPLVKKGYEKYPGIMIGDQDKSWAPHFSCATCAMCLRNWLNGSHKSMPFAVPMIWREQKDHITDCYFCITDISGFSTKNKRNKIYPNLASAMRPVNHTDSLEIPTPQHISRDVFYLQMKLFRWNLMKSLLHLHWKLVSQPFLV